MRHTLSVLMIVSVFVLVVTACDNKRDSSDFAGQWQLLEWRDASGNVKATKESGIYYKFQLKLLQLDYYHFCRYYLRPDSIILETAFYNEYNTDTPIPFEDIANFGIPSDGKFRITMPDNDRMVLSGKSGVLSFRRY